MATYLKKYVDRVHDVPPQLQRLFKLIRDLDERVVALQAAVEDKCRQSLGSAPPTKKQRAKAEAGLRDEIDADMQKILSLSEEKVGGDNVCEEERRIMIVVVVVVVVGAMTTMMMTAMTTTVMTVVMTMMLLSW